MASAISRMQQDYIQQPRFLNRNKSEREGWLASPIKHKIDSHLKIIEDTHKMLAITNIIIETASFDIQKIKAPNISDKEY